MKLDTVICGDALEVLKGLPAGSVNCCVTSPPYWGLRDYGTASWAGGDAGCDHNTFRGKPRPELPNPPAGWAERDATPTPGNCPKYGARRVDKQLGLEKTPEEFIAKMVEVFREVWRVLRDDGTLFLNLGDSYFGRGRGGGGSYDSERPGWREVPCGTSGREPVDYRANDCLCRNLCDVCRAAYQNHRFHNDNLLVSMLFASLSSPTLENMGFVSGHLPTLGFSFLENHILDAIRDFGRFSALSGELLLAFQESMPDVFSERLLAECWRRGNASSCLLCNRSFSVDVWVSGCKSVCTCGTGENGHPSDSGKSDIASLRKAYPHYTITSPASQILKPKDLCGIPWRVALALQGFAVVPFRSFSVWADELKLARESQDWEAVKIVEGKLRRMDFLAGLQSQGWYLRQDIIWHKPNPMPESVRDRCTKAHEYIFLMTKKPRYFYDAEAIKEPSKDPQDDIRRILKNKGYANKYGQDDMATRSYNRGNVPEKWDGGGTRNKRSVWTVTTKPYSEAHFATFPPDLILPCILAGCPEQVCKKCGEPRRRITESERKPTRNVVTSKTNGRDSAEFGNKDPQRHVTETTTTGWTDCGCGAGFDGGIVLDPFMGSGTVGLVAYQNNRHYIGIELNPEYCKLGRIEVERDKYALFNEGQQ